MPMKVTEGGGETLTAGVYSIKFASFAGKDDDEVPQVKQTEWGPKVYFNLAVMDGENDGAHAPLSTNPEDGLATWFKILTGSEIPKGKSLLELQSLMKQSTKTVKVVVNDKGWVSGLFIPKASYLARFDRFPVRDESGKPVWKEGMFKNTPTKKVFWQFEIVAGELAGTNAPGSCTYAVKMTNGELSIPSKSNLYSWASALGVEFGDLPDPANKQNCLPELEKAIQAAGRTVLIQIGDSGWVDSSQGAIAPPPAGVSIPASAPAKQDAGVPKVEDEMGCDKLADLYDAMSATGKAMGFGDLFNPQDGSFTDDGKRFCKEILAPICDDGGVPRKFSVMQEPHIEFLITRLKIEAEEVAAKQAGAPVAAASEDDGF